MGVESRIRKKIIPGWLIIHEAKDKGGIFDPDGVPYKNSG